MVTAGDTVDWDLAFGAVVCHEGYVDEGYDWDEGEGESAGEGGETHRALQFSLGEEAALLWEKREPTSTEWTSLDVLGLSHVTIEQPLTDFLREIAVEGTQGEIGLDKAVFADRTFYWFACLVGHFLDGNN